MKTRDKSIGITRRDFLNLAGAGAAGLALNNRLLAKTLTESPASRLSQTHDLLSLPLWGPYSKKYFGISHIPDVQRGLSFDLSIFPLLTAGPVTLPSVTGQSGVHPWEASPNVDFYFLRLETIWKDQLYCDLSFSPLSSDSRLVRLQLVNRTPTEQQLALHCLAQLVFPPVRELTAEPIRRCEVGSRRPRSGSTPSITPICSSPNHAPPTTWCRTESCAARSAATTA